MVRFKLRNTTNLKKRVLQIPPISFRYFNCWRNTCPLPQFLTTGLLSLIENFLGQFCFINICSKCMQSFVHGNKTFHSCAWQALWSHISSICDNRLRWYWHRLCKLEKLFALVSFFSWLLLRKLWIRLTS